MAVPSDVTSLAQDGADTARLHPHLLALVKWCASLVWGAAAELMRRLLDLQPTVPALLPLPPVAGAVRARLLSSARAPPPHISHAATVHCEVLRQPTGGADVDIIFVHGLYGSLANTWRQGQWRKKHKTELNKVPLKRHATDETICTCNQKHKTLNEIRSDHEECSCRNKIDYVINNEQTLQSGKGLDELDNTNDEVYRKEEFTNTDEENYVLSNVDIVQNYTDIMEDIFTSDEFSVYGENCDIDMILSSINENRTKSENKCDNTLNCDETDTDNFVVENKLCDRCDELEIDDQNRTDLESIKEIDNKRKTSVCTHKESSNNSQEIKTTKQVHECNCTHVNVTQDPKIENDEFDGKHEELFEEKTADDTKPCDVGCGCICPRCYSECWPRDWLGVDYPNSRVISISYTSDPHLWRLVWIKPHKRLRLHERAQQMAEQLLALGVGSRPIVWVGHSKGGLFIKQIYAEGYEDFLTHGGTRVSSVGQLWRQSVGFMFYSVPHRGSPLADFNIPPIVARSIELLEMGKDCADVLALQSRWLRAARGAHAQPVVRSLVETRRTLMAVLWLRIVSVESADAGIGALCGVSVDHREICKPSGRSCPLYRELLHVLDTALGLTRGGASVP